MSQITAAAVNELRKRTDLPLMDCKKALTATDGDIEKAIDLMRKEFGKVAIKRAGNETGEGRVCVLIDGTKAAIVELRCESAPSAKNELTGKLLEDVAKIILKNDLKDTAALNALPEVTTRIEETVGLIREKMVIHRFAYLSGGVFGFYVHHDLAGGALVQCEGTGSHDELLRDVGAHAVAMNPLFILPTDVPADVIAKETAFIADGIKADPKNATKPANIIEKMAEGKLKSWMGETVLLEQPMANATKYPGQTVGQALQKAGLKLTAVVRYKVGAA